MEHNHDKLVALVKNELPNDPLLSELTGLYKAFADKTRCKILFALLSSQLCVCALCELLSMEQSAISHQLRFLREANLVRSRRVGKTQVYFLSDDHVKSLLSIGFEHLLENKKNHE